MNKYVFVILRHNYSDEFDVDGCYVASREEFDLELAKIKKGFESGELKDKDFYFGTNEFLSFSSFGDFKRGLKVSPCSDSFYEEFKSLVWMSVGSIGFNVIEAMVERLSGPDEDDDKDDEDF